MVVTFVAVSVIYVIRCIEKVVCTTLLHQALKWGMHDIKRCMFICDFPVFIIESVVLTATVVVSCSVFWLFNALLLILDLTGRPQYLLRYKIQEGKNQPVRHVSCRVRLNVASCGKSFVRLIDPVK